MLLIEDVKDDQLGEETKGEEIIEYNRNQRCQETIFSVHSVTGEVMHSTIRLMGTLTGMAISIFLDGGGTNCFIETAVP